MEVDQYRIDKYLEEVTAETIHLNEILMHSDEEILKSPHWVKSCKYSIIIISEAIANTLQHIMAKKYKTVVNGYLEILTKTKQLGILSEPLLNRLRPFMGFRNMLVHHYWKVDDRQFVNNLRSGITDFQHFTKEIHSILENI